MSTAIDTRLSIDTLVQWLPIFGLAAQETWRPSAPRHGTNRTCVEATVRYAFELGYEVIDGKRRDGRLLGHRDARGSRC